MGERKEDEGVPEDQRRRALASAASAGDMVGEAGDKWSGASKGDLQGVTEDPVDEDPDDAAPKETDGIGSRAGRGRVGEARAGMAMGPECEASEPEELDMVVDERVRGDDAKAAAGSVVGSARQEGSHFETRHGQTNILELGPVAAQLGTGRPKRRTGYPPGGPRPPSAPLVVVGLAELDEWVVVRERHGEVSACW